MRKEQFIKLAQKYSQNNCSPAEIELVESFFQKLQEEYNDFSIELSEELRNELYLKISSRIENRNRRLRKLFYKSAKIAAVLVLFIALPVGLIFYVGNSKENIEQLTAKSEIKTILLPDGSQVVLNANSSINYSEDFKQKRTLKLSGEAFFKVVRDPKSPFVVETAEFKTKVLGTSFNIKAYPNRLSSVSVVTGKVEVVVKEHPNNKSILTKNQSLSFSNNKMPQIAISNSADFNAWTKNILIFQNSTLAEIAKTLENRFNISIVFEDESIEKLRVTGKFKEDNIANILSSIALVKQLEIQFLTKNSIYVKKKSNK